LLVIALVRLGASIGGLQVVEFLAMLLTGAVIFTASF